MTDFNPLGQHVTVGRISGLVKTIVRKGDKYWTDVRNDTRVQAEPTAYKGDSFVVVVDHMARSHHVLLSQI